MKKNTDRSRIADLLRRLARFGAYFLVMILGMWVATVLLFSVVPVPYSMVMADRQLSAWLSGDFSYVARQSWVSTDEISPHMMLAAMAGEDQKFPEHWGLDVDAIISVFQSSSRTSRPMRGASTITQQTAKNLFLWSERSWVRKGLEAGMSVGLEMIWSKRRILTVYLNIAEFGNGIFGVECAAQTFFKKPASRLTASEAALLAAVLPNPHMFRVDAPSAYVRQRQRWLMQQMNQLGGTAFMETF